MEEGIIGKHYRDGEVIVHQGEPGECMYIIQKGQVEVVHRTLTGEFCLSVLETGEFFGEMALVERDVRSATVRALGDAWVLSLQKKAFLRRVQDDPSLAFHVLEKLCHRIRRLNEALVRTGDVAQLYDQP